MIWLSTKVTLPLLRRCMRGRTGLMPIRRLTASRGRTALLQQRLVLSLLLRPQGRALARYVVDFGVCFIILDANVELLFFFFQKKKKISSAFGERRIWEKRKTAKSSSCLQCSGLIFFSSFFLSRSIRLFRFPVRSSTSVHDVVMKRLSVCTGAGGMAVRRHMAHSTI